MKPTHLLYLLTITALHPLCLSASETDTIQDITTEIEQTYTNFYNSPEHHAVRAFGWAILEKLQQADDSIEENIELYKQMLTQENDLEVKALDLHCALEQLRQQLMEKTTMSYAEALHCSSAIMYNVFADQADKKGYERLRTILAHRTPQEWDRLDKQKTMLLSELEQGSHPTTGIQMLQALQVRRISDDQVMHQVFQSKAAEKEAKRATYIQEIKEAVIQFFEDEYVKDTNYLMRNEEAVIQNTDGTPEEIIALRKELGLTREQAHSALDPLHYRLENVEKKLMELGMSRLESYWLSVAIMDTLFTRYTSAQEVEIASENETIPLPRLTGTQADHIIELLNRLDDGDYQTEGERFMLGMKARKMLQNMYINQKYTSH